MIISSTVLHLNETECRHFNRLNPGTALERAESQNIEHKENRLPKDNACTNDLLFYTVANIEIGLAGAVISAHNYDRGSNLKVQ